MAVCYRHSNRETGVSCSNCGRPICPDCMTPTPVGMRCPECSKQTTQVRRMATTYDRPAVTIALIAINVLIFFGMSTSSGGSFGDAGGRILRDYALFGPLVDSEPWRLVTAGFLHGGIIHIAFNMYILWFLGNILEPALGPYRFTALYFASLLTGSFGALVLSPNDLTVGASGAIFGLMGAAFVMQMARGIDPMQGGIGPMILINLAIGFLPGLNISIGGHLGGLIGGALAGYLMEHLGERRRGVALPIAICVGVGAAAVAGSFAIV